MQLALLGFEAPKKGLRSTSSQPQSLFSEGSGLWQSHRMVEKDAATVLHREHRQEDLRRVAGAVGGVNLAIVPRGAWCFERFSLHVCSLCVFLAVWSLFSLSLSLPPLSFPLSLFLLAPRDRFSPRPKRSIVFKACVGRR